MRVDIDQCSVVYDSEAARVTFDGTLQLRTMNDYAPVARLLDMAFVAGHSKISLDICDLDFLNSPGINTLLQFIIKVHERTNAILTVIGSKQVLWHEKFFKTLKQLMPRVNLELI